MDDKQQSEDSPVNTLSSKALPEHPAAEFSFVRLIMAVIMFVMLSRAAITLLQRYFAPLPTLQQLTLIEDRVAAVDVALRSSRYSANKKYIRIRLENEFRYYTYLDWFPDTLALKTELQPGDRVRLWVDKDAKDWVWQIEKEQSLVRSYHEVSAAITHNYRFNWLFAVILLMCGAALLIQQLLLLQKWRKSRRAHIEI